MTLGTYKGTLLMPPHAVIKELTAEREGGTGKIRLEQMVANNDLLKEGRENAEALLSLMRDKL